jgi:hypothetical protein
MKEGMYENRKAGKQERMEDEWKDERGRKEGRN